MHKDKSYRTLKLISWAMIESACLFTLVALFLTTNNIFAIIFVALLIIFFLQRPSKESFIVDFRLNDEEREIVHRS